MIADKLMDRITKKLEDNNNGLFSQLPYLLGELMDRITNIQESNNYRRTIMNIISVDIDFLLDLD